MRSLARHGSLLLLALALAACATMRPVTSGGVPATDTTVIAAANAIACIERTMVAIGDILLAQRQEFTDAEWSRIADTSSALKDALFLARDSLRAYEAAATGANADKLQAAINVLTTISAAYAAYQGGTP